MLETKPAEGEDARFGLQPKQALQKRLQGLAAAHADMEREKGGFCSALRSSETTRTLCA